MAIRGPGDATDPGTAARVGWLAVATGFVSMFTVFGVAYSFGAFFEAMADEFGAGRAATSAVFSITAFLYFLLGVVSGRATDRFGPRPVLLTGAAALGGGLALTATVDRLWLGYLTYGIGVGAAVASGYVPALAIITSWFDERRSLALGVAVAGVGLGTLSVAPVAGALVEQIGWRSTYLVFAAVGASLLAGCAMVMPRARTHIDATPTRARDTVRTPAFASLYSAGFLLSLALFVPFVFLPSFAEARGVGKVSAASLVGVIGAASVVGRLLLGMVGDRLGRVRTYQGCFGLVAVSFLIWLASDRFVWLVVFAVVLGVGYGGFITLNAAVAADIFGMHGLGGTIGLLYTSAAGGALVGPPLAGEIIDRTGGYDAAITVALLFCVGAFLALLPLPRSRPSPLSTPAWVLR